MKKPPPHPGKAVKELCLDANNMAVGEAADRLGVSRQALSALLHGRAGISPEMAVRLARVFGGPAEVWLRLQNSYDLWGVNNDASIKVKPLKLEAAE